MTVTAERRTQNLQKVAASVEVVRGSDIEAQGKITTAQILEDVPNLVVGPQIPIALDNPNGNITIRGVQTTQQTGGTEAPSTTATYVDDVYQGIGGDFDINRVEVLRGPQGTLYGRSATGGVVAFHTNDPELGKLDGYVTGEYGSADLRQVIAALNVPILPQVALRVAAREFDQNGYYNSTGGATRDQEARVKLLYQPLSNLSFLGSWSINEQHIASGGIAPSLSAPNTIQYTGTYVTPAISESRMHQMSIDTKYDFGVGTLTYIGAYHDYALNGLVVNVTTAQTLDNYNKNPLDQFNSQELRIASDPGSPLTWLVGGNFYSNQFKTSQDSVTAYAYEPNTTIIDTTPGALNAQLFDNGTNARIFDYGLFTEETYPVLPDLRITAGARFDETKVNEFSYYYFNTNLDQYGDSLSPANDVFYSAASSEIFRNFTYKLRAEYDLTPVHMLYAMVSSGFLPGEQQLSPHVVLPDSVVFHVLPFAQERLTSYEIGSKNRFLDNTLQVNGAAFYYNYSGYQEAANTASHGPPTYTLLSVPLRIVGAEMDALWQFSPNDRLSFSGGITDAEVTTNPYVSGIGYVSEYLALRRLPGVIPVQFTVAYTHTILFPDGSTLVPRAQARFYGAYDVANLTATEVALGEQAYVHQGATVVGDIDLDWTSSNRKYSVDGYVRNIANNIYKAVVGPSSTGLAGIDVTPSNPRVLGVVVTAKF